MHRSWSWGVLCLVACCAPAVAAEPAAEAQEESGSWRLDGIVKLDMSWDEALVDSGNFARWVLSPAVAEEHHHFNLTARQTRIGLGLPERSTERLRLTGRVEVDFYGGGAENKNLLQLRHAYALLSIGDRWSILAGQSSDVISPLVPSTLNYTVAWWVGNIGYRRPQLRATWHPSGGAAGFSLTTAVARSIGDDFTATEPGDAGSDSGTPSLQARLGYAAHSAVGKRALGLWGHRGQETIHGMPGEPTRRFDSWSVGVDLDLALTGATRLALEAWRGANLDDYLGGVGQGLDVVRGLEVESRGGWLAVERRGERWRLALGGGVDDPDDATLPAGARLRNQALWVSAVRRLPLGLEAGVELSRWTTDYEGVPDGSSYRVQTSLVWSF